MELPDTQKQRSNSFDMEEWTKGREKTIQIRGAILDLEIKVETLIDKILINYYSRPKKKDEFLLDLLLDENFNCGLKRKVLYKVIHKLGWSPWVLTFKEFRKKLYRIGEIRNFIAHARSITDLKEPTGKMLLDAAKREMKDIEELHKEIIPLLSEVLPELDDIYKKVLEHNAI